MFDPKKRKRLIPVKLIGGKLVKINKDYTPIKEPKEPIRKPKSSTKTLETSYSTNSYKSTNSNISNIRLVRNLSQKFDKLVDDIKEGKEIVGTIEEKRKEFPTKNPFLFKTNLDHHNYISKNKQVLFKKPEKNEYVLKIIDSDLYMTIYNKTQPPKRVYNKSEIKRIIKLQKRFKGFAIREVEQKVRNLKVSKCLLEVLCLIIVRAFDNAKKKLMYLTLKSIFFDPFSINDEIYFKDKLDFKLPNKYYNMETIQQLDLYSKNKFKPKKKEIILKKLV